MALIPLSGRRGKGLFTQVDDDVYELLSRHTWNLTNCGYVKRTDGALMHRIIANPPKGLVVDHANGNRIDNRRSNLRVCTHSENSCNKPAQVNNTTGYKGVWFHKKNQSYSWDVKFKGRRERGNGYMTASEAARDRDAVAIRMQKEFALINDDALLRKPRKQDAALSIIKKQEYNGELPDGVRAIPLTRGKFALVDDFNYEWLMKWNWTYSSRGRAVSHDKENHRKTILMHRVVANTPDNMVCDHIDGNSLNNTVANLRNCTQDENMRNMPVLSNNTSGYKGVSRRKNGNWQAYITIGKNRRHLGTFPTPQEAAIAYNKAAIELHGEFARLNFP